MAWQDYEDEAEVCDQTLSSSRHALSGACAGADKKEMENLRLKCGESAPGGNEDGEGKWCGEGGIGRAGPGSSRGRSVGEWCSRR